MRKSQKAILTFTHNPDGTLGISIVFEPEVTDETRSDAVSCAVNCLNYISDHLTEKEVE